MAQKGFVVACVVCGVAHRIKGIKPPEGKFLCPKCLKKVEEHANRKIN